MDIFKAATLYQNHSIILNSLWMFYVFIALLTLKFASENQSIIKSKGVLLCFLIGFCLFAFINGTAIVMAEKFRAILWFEIFDAGMNMQMQGAPSADLSIGLSNAIRELDYFTPQRTAFIHVLMDVCMIGLICGITKLRQATS